MSKYSEVTFGIPRKWRMKEHRFVWMKAYGDIPEGMVIDHINEDKGDNRLENLQCITQGQNAKRSLLGSVYKRYRKWVAYRIMDGVRHHVSFGTKCGAYMYNQARRYL